MPAGYQFPRVLVEWMLNPPRSWFLGHHCERCGLGVPLLTTWSNDPNPAPSIVVFPACPACSGPTSFAPPAWASPITLHRRIEWLGDRLPADRAAEVPTDPTACRLLIK